MSWIKQSTAARVERSKQRKEFQSQWKTGRKGKDRAPDPGVLSQYKKGIVEIRGRRAVPWVR